MDKRFLAVVAVIVIGLGAVFYVSNRNDDSAPASSERVAPTEHVKGEGEDVRLVEYGDYQCPACAQYEPILQQVQAKYNDHITFQFRNFPLVQIHQNAMASARAAEAADMQGKFWEMHDVLFQNQQAWANAGNPLEIFTGYANQLDLDTAKFQEDYKSSAANDRIQADLAEGNRLGISSTPTFVLNGKVISNPNATLDDFSRVIDAEIKKQGGTPPADDAGATSESDGEPSGDSSAAGGTRPAGEEGSGDAGAAE